MDLPMEHLRRGERSYLLPLTANSPEARHGGLPRHRAHFTRDRLGAMLNEGGSARGTVTYYESTRPLSRGGSNYTCVQ